MSITIHYSGYFNKKANLNDMIDEVSDIADGLEWDKNIFERQFPDLSLDLKNYNRNIYGLNVIPPGSEPLYLSFLSNGRMCNRVSLDFFGQYSEDGESQYLGKLSTKTQYAGPDTHKLIIHLLKYLDEKYFGRFELFDEAEYWETGDEECCEEHFRTMNEILDKVAIGLNSLTKDMNESYEDYFERLLKIISEK